LRFIRHNEKMQKRFYTLSIFIMLAACSSPSAPPPSPSPRPVARPAPVTSTTTAPVQAVQGNWTDWPISAGNWIYRTDNRGSIALYGQPGLDALLTLRCDTARGRIYLSRSDERGVGAGTITIRSSSALKKFAGAPTGGTPAYTAIEIMPFDGILDAMAFSRGRIAIEADGQQSVAIPVWSEIGRVVEDCRK
jgi:hypothetical protein